MDSLSGKSLKPSAKQEDDQFFVRIRQKGYRKQQMTFDSRQKAEDFCQQIDAERSRGLFRDYTKSHSNTYTDLMVRFLLKDAPKHKSFQIQACEPEGWLDDSEVAKGRRSYRCCSLPGTMKNDSVDFGGVRFLGTTLWTDYRLDLNRECRVVANLQGYVRNVSSAAKVGALDFENRNFGWACMIEVQRLID